jgi:hypothetical protein
VLTELGQATIPSPNPDVGDHAVLAILLARLDVGAVFSSDPIERVAMFVARQLHGIDNLFDRMAFGLHWRSYFVQCLFTADMTLRHGMMNWSVLISAPFG